MAGGGREGAGQQEEAVGGGAVVGPVAGEEAREFAKLHKLIPHLTSRTASQLDIVLEAITYINLLKQKLLDEE